MIRSLFSENFLCDCSSFFNVVEPFTFGGKYDIEKIDKSTKNLILEVPGISKKDLNITFKEDTRLLSVTAETNGRILDKNFNVSKNTKVVDATLEDGILKIQLHDCTPPEQEAIKITVR